MPVFSFTRSSNFWFSSPVLAVCVVAYFKVTPSNGLSEAAAPSVVSPSAAVSPSAFVVVSAAAVVAVSAGSAFFEEQPASDPTAIAAQSDRETTRFMFLFIVVIPPS